MASDVLCLTQAVYDEIVAHAREGKPEEVCGILRGRGRRVFGLVRGRNVAPDPIMDYVIDAPTLLRQFDFEEDGDAMVAIYHSHPVSPAYPSASDAWNAYYPDSVYLICSLEDDASPTLCGFRMTAHEVALDLPKLRAALDFDETRPGRFAYYKAPDTPLPPMLDAIAAQVPQPFYIVFEFAQETDESFTSRCVSIQKCDIQIVPS